MTQIEVQLKKVNGIEMATEKKRIYKFIMAVCVTFGMFQLLCLSAAENISQVERLLAILEGIEQQLDLNPTKENLKPYWQALGQLDVKQLEGELGTPAITKPVVLFKSFVLMANVGKIPKQIEDLRKIIMPSSATPSCPQPAPVCVAQAPDKPACISSNTLQSTITQAIQFIEQPPQNVSLPAYSGVYYDKKYLMYNWSNKVTKQGPNNDCGYHAAYNSKQLLEYFSTPITYDQPIATTYGQLIANIKAPKASFISGECRLMLEGGQQGQGLTGDALREFAQTLRIPEQNYTVVENLSQLTMVSLLDQAERVISIMKALQDDQPFVHAFIINSTGEYRTNTGAVRGGFGHYVAFVIANSPGQITTFHVADSGGDVYPDDIATQSKQPQYLGYISTINALIRFLYRPISVAQAELCIIPQIDGLQNKINLARDKEYESYAQEVLKIYQNLVGLGLANSTELQIIYAPLLAQSITSILQDITLSKPEIISGVLNWLNPVLIALMQMLNGQPERQALIQILARAAGQAKYQISEDLKQAIAKT